MRSAGIKNRRRSNHDTRVEMPAHEESSPYALHSLPVNAAWACIRHQRLLLENVPISRDILRGSQVLHGTAESLFLYSPEMAPATCDDVSRADVVSETSETSLRPVPVLAIPARVTNSTSGWPSPAWPCTSRTGASAGTVSEGALATRGGARPRVTALRAAPAAMAGAASGEAVLVLGTSGGATDSRLASAGPSRHSGAPPRRGAVLLAAGGAAGSPMCASGADGDLGESFGGTENAGCCGAGGCPRRAGPTTAAALRGLSRRSAAASRRALAAGCKPG
mmetsp:Transcript_93996/g.303588  ORF Transcript_93996/g.303588 Transcript_93996/m.303588 type:complete len:279 (-) Transcript_93996:756-1592(-)